MAYNFLQIIFLVTIFINIHVCQILFFFVVCVWGGGGGGAWWEGGGGGGGWYMKNIINLLSDLCLKNTNCVPGSCLNWICPAFQTV